MAPVFLGIDLGTSLCKVIAVDSRGSVIARTTRSYPIHNPRPGWSEQDPEHWWQATDEAITELTTGLPERGLEVAGIGLCGQMHGLTPLDADGNVLRPAILWNDQRCAPECDWITERAGGLDRLLKLTGNPMLPGYTGGKIVWLREHEPQVHERVAHVLNPKDYLRYRMNGALITDVTDASGTGLFDVARRCWSGHLLDLLAIDRGLLPDVVESPEPSGPVHSELARRWNIPESTQIFGGGGDAVIQTTAMGIVEPGAVGLTLGTAGIVAGAHDSCPGNPGGRLQISCGNGPGRWHAMGVSLSAGGALQWLRDALQPLLGDQPLPFDRLIDLAKTAPEGSDGLLFLPYLLGERCPHLAPEATATWVGLTLRHNVGHMARSVIEGVLLNIRAILDICVESGIRCERMLVSGGATGEEFWLSLLADILGQDITTVTGSTEGGAYGAALVAGTGFGNWSTVEEAVSVVAAERTYQPNLRHVSTYSRVFDGHSRLYRDLAGAYADSVLAEQR